MNPLRRVAIVLGAGAPSATDRNISKVAQFFGVKAIDVSSEPSAVAAALDAATDGAEYCLISSARHLLDLGALQGPDESPLARIAAAATSMFVCDFSDGDSMNRLLSALTGDPEAEVRPGDGTDEVIDVTAGWPEFCGPMSGIGALAKGSGATPRFAFSGKSSSMKTLVGGASSSCYFVESAVYRTQTFICSSGIGIDIQASTSAEYFDVKESFLDAVPLVLYLRWAFAEQIGPDRCHLATLVVDDPLLRPRYGFLDFDDALAAMRRENFSTTIAFIPWNWWRSKKGAVDLFARNPGHLSLVVHGNDHTGGEFGIHAGESLNGMVAAATSRMEKMHQRTGIAWSKVMVFPQGVFSIASLRALKCNNFIAAANTEVRPTDRDAQRIAISELWNMAIMRYASFAVYTRRYMHHGIENIAFDLALGKPCVLVAHHDAFRNSAHELIEFVRKINALDCDVVWTSLHDVAIRTHRSNSNEDGSIEVQMFANELVFENKSESPRTVRISKLEDDAAAVEVVLVDGIPVPWKWESGRVMLAAVVPGGGSVRIQVVFKGCSTAVPYRPRWRYRVRCAIRRVLSEVRDDYVSRNRTLQACARRLRSLRNT